MNNKNYNKQTSQKKNKKQNKTTTYKQKEKHRQMKKNIRKIARCALIFQLAEIFLNANSYCLNKKVNLLRV